ncbi:hypothetical protein [Rubrivirga sp. IMCC45206]|uniref:hypothetical protein n=1 Tax=Rubrivirga sp. IMCC45206 TaxID=3391614 RepID=UPI00398F9B85
MIAWTGHGLLVPLIAFGCLIAAEAAVEGATGDPAYYQEHTWPMALGFIVAGALVAALAKRFPDSPGRAVVDAETGEPFTVKGTVHTFMLIPVRSWTPILFALGLLAPVLFA